MRLAVKAVVEDRSVIKSHIETAALEARYLIYPEIFCLRRSPPKMGTKQSALEICGKHSGSVNRGQETGQSVGSTLKSPGTARRRNLRVTFQPPQDRTDYKIMYDSNANSVKNGYSPAVKKVISPAYRSSRYDSDYSNKGSDGKGANYSVTHSSTVRPAHAPRSRSISPSRSRAASHVSRSKEEMRENVKNALRTRSQSASRLNSKSHTRDDNMTSFIIGKPVSFRSGAFGDLGVFKAISAISDSLFICGAMALSEEKVKALRIDFIVNATLEWPSLKIPGLETLRVTVDDVPGAPLHMYFDTVADRIHKVLSRGGRALVHCMAGVSRSSSLCIAYLMKYKGLSLQQALSLMRSRRPIVRPNDGFWRQLVEYERRLRAPNKLVKKTFRSPEEPRKSGTLSSVRSSPQRPIDMMTSRVSATLPLRGNRSTGSMSRESQKGIAASAMRSNEHWRTTYGSDYRPSARR